MARGLVGDGSRGGPDDNEAGIAPLDLRGVIEIRAALGDNRFELDLGDGRQLRIPATFDDEALGRLLLVLEAVR